MAQPVDLENDEFLQLLSEALRAGPGSPAWHQAIARLRQQGESATGAGNGDQYKLLMEARENLESGKEYRSVRAGPEFTRKVLQGLEEDPGGRLRGLPTGNLLAVLAAGVILAVVLTIGYLLMQGGDRSKSDAGDLARQVFTQTTLATTFDGALPAQWRPIGQLALEASKGLHLAKGGGSNDAYLGAGVVTAVPIPATRTWAIEVELRPSRTAEGVITQVFVTDQTEFSPEKGTSGHELTVVLGGGKVSIVSPAGHEEVQSKLEKGAITVRIAVNQDSAVVSVGDQRIWAGAHQLDPEKTRLFGVRLLRKGNDARDPAAVQSIRLLQP